MSAANTWNIALVIVRDGDRFLLVHEKKDRGWYLPAGRVEPHETFAQGAIRETIEESGVEVELDGIIRLEHTPSLAGRDSRMRVIFLAHPIGGALKTEPDSESLGAAWCTIEEASQLRLRSDEVLKHFQYVANGGVVAPIDLLTWEGAPYSPGAPSESY